MHAAGSSYENKAGLSAEKLTVLLKGLEQLKDYGEPLHDRVVRYVLDGGNDSVLAELATRPDAANALQLDCSTQYGSFRDDSSWSVFLKTIEPIAWSCYYRLGKVFEAAANALPPDRFFCDAVFEHARWLEILLQEATQIHARTWSSRQRRSAITGPMIEDMLQADGRSPEAFVRSAFTANTLPWSTGQSRELVLSVAELGKTYDRHRDLVAGYVMSGAAVTRVVAVENLTQASASPAVFVGELAACATNSSKKLREASEVLLRGAPNEARPHLERLARDGDRYEREHAVRLLGRLCGESVRSVLESLLETEKSVPVREAIQAMLTELRPAAAAGVVPTTAAPAHEPIALHVPITPALRPILERLIDEYNAHAVKHNDLIDNPPAQPWRVYPKVKLSALPPESVDRLGSLLEHGGDLTGPFNDTLLLSQLLWGAEPKGAYKQFLEHPDCSLIHLVRMLAINHHIIGPTQQGGGVQMPARASLELFRRTHHPRFSLMQLADAVRSVGLTDDMLVENALGPYGSAWDWEPKAVWPFFSKHLEALGKTFDPPTGDWSSRYARERSFPQALRILATFPHVPDALTGKLWDLSIGTNKSDRLLAQSVAVKLPDLQGRLAKALTSGNHQTRAIAAEWLGRLNDRQGIGPLDAAARKEKQDATLDEILTALERLGQPIEPYLDRERLEQDAAKGLKKGVPEGMAWFPWAGMPKVHWQDTGKEVTPEVVTWLLVQNFKAKSAEAGPLLRRYCGLMGPQERAALGDFVLRAWLAHDLRPKYTAAEARTLAQQNAGQTYQAYQYMLQSYQKQGQTPPPSLLQSPAQVEESLYQNNLKTPDSAVAEKGVLAVAGACCGDSAVAPVQQYLKQWYGYRAAQCKVLIAMLSTIDRPSAIQYLLSIANRFRTKGIREEAEKYVQVLAERKHWTLDELGDRTLSTAGFDDDGQLVLDFGPRQFMARVSAGLEAVLYDDEKKPLKAIPAPRKDDDAALVNAAKKVLSSAKSELKQFAGLQKTRLYEAMCTQRTWSAADWQRYLLGHPLLRFLCQRLIWAVCDGDRVTTTFRPLDDGSLTDVADEEVTLSPTASVRLAHECQVPADVSAAWNKHLADYDVAPLFTQFGRGVYTLAEDRRAAVSLDDFQGHMVEAFKLRGLAAKFGYTRGAAEDGGWFYEYLKLFPGLGLEVHLRFTGNGLPEENRTVALAALTFSRPRPREAGFSPIGDGRSLPLSEIPAVLIAECYNDLRSIAATGTGFDPEWEKKAYN